MHLSKFCFFCKLVCTKPILITIVFGIQNPGHIHNMEMIFTDHGSVWGVMFFIRMDFSDKHTLFSHGKCTADIVVTLLEKSFFLFRRTVCRTLDHYFNGMDQILAVIVKDLLFKIFSVLVHFRSILTPINETVITG